MSAMSERDQQAHSVISLGDLAADLMVRIPRFPIEADAHQVTEPIHLEPGGAGNFLIAGARLGMNMLALGTIGDDFFGQAALEILRAQGVQTESVIQQAGTSTTTVVVLVDPGGSHVFLGSYGAGPEIQTPTRWREAVRGAQACFASGYTFREARIARAALGTMEEARERGLQVFFDPGPQMKDAEPDQVERALAASHVLLLTEEEIPFMTGGETGLEAARALAAARSLTLCVKQGDRGALLLSPEGESAHQGFSVPVRDTTAAGDSFDAAFIYGSLQGWSPIDRLRFANAMGAAKVQKIGSGRAVPTRAEIEAVLAAHNVHLDF
jgi:sugar/nucleoside kinase (ribokinase family)